MIYTTKLFKFGYSLNAWLWLISIITMIFLKDKFSESITEIAKIGTEKFGITFFFWIVFIPILTTIVLDLIIVWGVLPKINK